MPLPQAFIDLCTGPSVAAERAAKDFHAMASALNAPTERGAVPLRELSSLCLAMNVTPAVKALLDIPLGQTVEGVTMTVALRAGLYRVLTLIETDFRLESADADDGSFAAGCDGLIALGFLDAAGKAALLALGDNRTGRAEAALGRPCTAVDCWEACGGDS